MFAGSRTRRHVSLLSAFLVVFLAVVGLVSPASADTRWSQDGEPVCTSAGGQGDPCIVGDDTGGAIVAWLDHSTSRWRVMAQRMGPNGEKLWPAEGIEVSAGSTPAIASDGLNGAVIAWQAGTDIFAQRVSTYGALLWTSPGRPASEGVPVCVAPGEQCNPRIVSAGSGNVIVSWEDTRSDPTPGHFFTASDIYAQKLNSWGVTVWADSEGARTRGVPVCEKVDVYEAFHKTVADGAGGAIFGWYEGGSEWIDSDIFAQRLNARGEVMWSRSTYRGKTICSADSEQQMLDLSPTGYGGAFFAWQDVEGLEYDISAQLVSPSGDLLWCDSGESSEDGFSICEAPGSQSDPHVVTFGSQAIVAWVYSPECSTDYCPSTESRYLVCATKLDASGRHIWGSGAGSPLFDPPASTGGRYFLTMAGDGTGGAFALWSNALGNTSITAQHVSWDGRLTWDPSTALPVCSASGNLWRIVPGNWIAMDDIDADGYYGAVVAWMDSSGSPNTDIYAQRITRFPPPEISSITPNKGYKSGTPISVTIEGRNFMNLRGVPEVSLEWQGKAPIQGYDVVFVSPERLTCKFNLSTAALGYWHLAVKNRDGQSCMRKYAFEVKKSEADIVVPGTPPGGKPPVVYK